MKMSKFLHITSVIIGFVGVLTFLGAVLNSVDGMVFGITKMDALACTAILILIATWAQIGAIHHVMLEKNGEVI